MSELLGKTLEDRISGFTGIAFYYAETLSGMQQYGLQPKGKPDKLEDAQCFDVQVLQVVDEGVSAVLTKPTATFPGKLGDRVKDTITGITGIAVEYVTFFNGCLNIGVERGLDKDGKKFPIHAINAVNAELEKKAEVEAPRPKTGGPALPARKPV